jgi:hypothetical protein
VYRNDQIAWQSCADVKARFLILTSFAARRATTKPTQNRRSSDLKKLNRCFKNTRHDGVGPVRGSMVQVIPEQRDGRRLSLGGRACPWRNRRRRCLGLRWFLNDSSIFKRVGCAPYFHGRRPCCLEGFPEDNQSCLGPPVRSSSSGAPRAGENDSSHWRKSDFPKFKKSYPKNLLNLNPRMFAHASPGS